MSRLRPSTFAAFAGHRLIAAGDGPHVAAAASAALARGEARVLVFDDATGEQVELTGGGGAPQIARRSEPAAQPRRGRPRLGVVAREVTLLPRHWEWLATQSGGASAALRRLVETASRDVSGADRQAQERVFRVMSALAGDLPGYEDAIRALFAGQYDTMAAAVAGWPPDVRAYVLRLAQ